jgi:hypothetical protein
MVAEDEGVVGGVIMAVVEVVAKAEEVEDVEEGMGVEAIILRTLDSVPMNGTTWMRKTRKVFILHVPIMLQSVILVLWLVIKTKRKHTKTTKCPHLNVQMQILPKPVISWAEEAEIYQSVTYQHTIHHTTDTHNLLQS